MSENSMAATGERTDLIITRVFDAPIELVWRAWTEPEMVVRWWGPTGFTSPGVRMDVREGGTSILCMRAPREFGGQDMYSTWEYRRIVPMERMEFIHNLSDKDGNKLDPITLGMPSDFPKDQLQVVLFKALEGEKTEITVIEYGWDAAGEMIKLSRLGMEQSLDKMEAMLAEEEDHGG